MTIEYTSLLQNAKDEMAAEDGMIQRKTEATFIDITDAVVTIYQQERCEVLNEKCKQ